MPLTKDNLIHNQAGLWPCPACQNDLHADPNSPVLMDDEAGVMLGCGKCGEISTWNFKGAQPIVISHYPQTLTSHPTG